MFSHVKVAQNFKEALMVQIRVVYALMLRETKSVFGRSKFGYLWVVIQTAFNVVVIWVIRAVVHSGTIPGLPLPVFLICGFTAWRIFSDTVTKVMMAVEANNALLYFSKVRYFDLALARGLLITATNLVVFVILMTIAYLLGYSYPIPSLWPLLYSITLLLLLGLGIGLICCAIRRYTESVGVLISMIMRIGVFISGVMFSLSHLPSSMKFLIDWNPILQLVEYSRTSFSYSYTGGESLRPGFVSLVVIVTLLGGMALEVVTRTKTDKL